MDVDPSRLYLCVWVKNSNAIHSPFSSHLVLVLMSPLQLLIYFLYCFSKSIPPVLYSSHLFFDGQFHPEKSYGRVSGYHLISHNVFVAIAQLLFPYSTAFISCFLTPSNCCLSVIPSISSLYASIFIFFYFSHVLSLTSFISDSPAPYPTIGNHLLISSLQISTLILGVEFRLDS